MSEALRILEYITVTFKQIIIAILMGVRWGENGTVKGSGRAWEESNVDYVAERAWV